MAVAIALLAIPVLFIVPAILNAVVSGVATGEGALYANVIIKKGVVK